MSVIQCLPIKGAHWNTLNAIFQVIPSHTNSDLKSDCAIEVQNTFTRRSDSVRIAKRRDTEVIGQLSWTVSRKTKFLLVLN